MQTKDMETARYTCEDEDGRKVKVMETTSMTGWMDPENGLMNWAEGAKSFFGEDRQAVNYVSADTFLTLDGKLLRVVKTRVLRKP